MENCVSIIKSNITFTPFVFYNDFLKELSIHYSKNLHEVVFKLFENGDDFVYDSKYRIDPITIPLLLSLLEQLCKFHKHSIPLLLYNNIATKKALAFLYHCDFFYLCSENKNPSFPIGRNIADFNDNYLGDFKGENQRLEHRVRAYSLDEDNLRQAIHKFTSEDQQRDYLISHYTYKVREHFEELLFDNEFTNLLHNTYIDLLSELITNGVLHSRSNTYALMFVNKFNTKFSISDNGIGLEASMNSKTSTFYYKPLSLRNILSKQSRLINISERILNNLFFIFEALFYSSLKERRGLFDLMVNVVLKSKGYFRIHSENCQVMISNRMMNELIEMGNYRSEIFNLHSKFLLQQIDETHYIEGVTRVSGQIMSSFVNFFNKTVEKYNDDMKYSALRFYNVKFRGVHIEVEIPNS